MKKDSPKLVEHLTKRPSFEVPDLCIPTLINELDNDIAAPLFKELYYSFRQNDLSSLLKVRALFMELISVILGARFTEHGVDKYHFHQKTISQSIQYMKLHYADKISIPTIAQAAGLSSIYFGNLFKTMTGLSVHEYLLDIRMQNAKRLLLNTEQSVEQISESIGICDVFYFTKLFKRHEGVTPAKYRRMLTNQIL